MYRDDHPWPHFHAWYAGDEISVRIDDGDVVGYLPPRQTRLVRRWWKLRRQELTENWRLVEQEESPRYIDPLP
jgi:hypothetical protein